MSNEFYILPEPLTIELTYGFLLMILCRKKHKQL